MNATSVVLHLGFFYNAAGKGGGPPKKKPDPTVAVGYSAGLVDTEMTTLLSQHGDPAEQAVISAAAADLKARAAHFQSKGVTVTAVAPVFPVGLFDVEPGMYE